MVELGDCDGIAFVAAGIEGKELREGHDDSIGKEMNLQMSCENSRDDLVSQLLAVLYTSDVFRSLDFGLSKCDRHGPRFGLSI